MSDLEFRFNKDNHIEFNKVNKFKSTKENDNAELNDEDKAIPTNFKWQVIKVINEHNHPKAKDIRVFPEHRQLTRDTKCMAVQMLKAGAKPSIIYEAIRGENRELIATRRDISNLGAQIYHSEENASMKMLIINMEKRGYTVHHENYEDRHIKHLSFCHDNSIQDAKRFSEASVILELLDYKPLA
ncbi:10808_t:CDS:2 [Cetraspora pellucida]|uniref:10808_t:CDS:1 n=1 Tax=Cetraspora pellucida TaxID=1433469 RepID=A0ACA9KDZ3_9GLOM|nr:10808_t:CDS:2 [Cetraspora pellucida]